MRPTLRDRKETMSMISFAVYFAKEEVTGARGVGVVIEARHFCMMMRGVEKQNSTMASSVMLGDFREQQATRSEFMRLIGQV